MPTTLGDPGIERLRSEPATWDAFVQGTANGSHLQSTAWARVKAANGWYARRVVTEAGNGPIGVQLLIRRLGPTPFGVGYAPRGPVGAADPASVAALTHRLARLARHERLSHVTMDSPWGQPVTAETDGGEDSDRAGVRVMAVSVLDAAGWHPTDAVQHDRTRIVDLGDETRMWSNVRSRTRRYVNAARKQGVTVHQEGVEAMDEFHSLLAATAARAGFIYRDAGSYRRVLEEFRDDAHLLMARTVAGHAVAGLLLVRYGDTVAEPSGGMDDEGASTRANYLLKWEAMARASASGARRYDMWGIAHGGIDQFKAGFGGHEIRYPGAFDLQTLPLLRPGLVAARRAWVAVARRRRGLERSGSGGGPADGGPAVGAQDAPPEEARPEGARFKGARAVEAP